MDGLRHDVVVADVEAGHHPQAPTVNSEVLEFPEIPGNFSAVGGGNCLYHLENLCSRCSLGSLLLDFPVSSNKKL